MEPATAIITAILALAPPPDTPPAVDVADAEVTTSDGVVTLTAYDADGEVSAEVATWTDEGDQHVDLVFPDGLYLFMTIDGGKVEYESNGAAEVVERAVAMETSLASWEDVDLRHGVGCGLAVVSTVAACAYAPLLACGAAAGWAGFHCSLVAEELDK